MAETITDLLCKDLQKEGIVARPSITKNLKLSGGEFDSPTDYATYTSEKAKDLMKLGLTNTEASALAAMYGTNTDIMLGLAEKVLNETNLPLIIKLTLQYAIDYEMAITPVDYLLRRTGSILFNISFAQKWKREVVDYMAYVLNWDEETKERMWTELLLQLQQTTEKVPVLET